MYRASVTQETESSAQSNPMESFDSLYLILGIIAAGIGIYMLLTYRFVGRKEGDVPKKHRKEIVRLDAATYIACGVISILLGMGSMIPFVSSMTVQLVLIVIGVGLIFFNYLLGKKILNK